MPDIARKKGVVLTEERVLFNLIDGLEHSMGVTVGSGGNGIKSLVQGGVGRRLVFENLRIRAACSTVMWLVRL